MYVPLLMKKRFSNKINITWMIRSHTKQKHVMKINKTVSNNLVGYEFFIGTLKCFVCLDSLCVHKRHSSIIPEEGRQKANYSSNQGEGDNTLA